MAENATSLDVVELPRTDANGTGTANGTATWGGPGAFENLGFCLLELKIIFSALGLIYLGSHAALRRPPSALKPAAKKGGYSRLDRDKNDLMQGLVPSDAVMFPLMAGVLLAGLYYLIQWLQDPDIVNRILRTYMSTVSIVSLLTLYTHGLQLFVSFLFPRYWRARDGSLKEADQAQRALRSCDDAGNPLGRPLAMANPCPCVPDRLVRSERSRGALWEARDVLKRRWLLKYYLRGVVKGEEWVKFTHVTAFFLSTATALVYFYTTSTFLSNVLGYGMCYASFLIISPTDFLTSALVLVGLFLYDIVMVFYTPYMITVATTLDVPIKLTFETDSRRSILGLGDIIIPGMVIAWALRFDLWLHYAHEIKYDKTDVKITHKDAASGGIVTRAEMQHREVKAPYVEVKGVWAEFWWTRRFPYRSQALPSRIAAVAFPKVYFYSSMAGYLAGMLVTLAMLLVFKRGQPALLYLVPGVLGSICLTALCRKDLKQLWGYTEDGSLDTADAIVELDSSGRVRRRLGVIKDGVVDLAKATGDSKGPREQAEGAEESTAKDKDVEKSGNKPGHIFYISMEAIPDDQVS